ncbi:MAG: hypothetical protein LBL04_04785 [Bacteroidales bacterium]|nr:hypothetical protein [Bacteroidales bacterium]
MFCIVMVGRAAAHPDSLIYRSIGVGFPSINYSPLSSLNHSGYSLGSHSTRFREKPNSLTQFQLHFELGLLYNNASDLYITTFGFNSSWSRHWHVTDRSRPLRLMLGGGANIGVKFYLKEDNTDNPLAYWFNLSVSPSILVQYRFNIHKTKFELGQQIEAPPGSLIFSSGYFSMVSFGSLKKCVAVTSLDITLPLERRQWPTFRVSYMFSGMNYVNSDFTVKFVDHIILFGTIFDLFR